MVTDNYTKFKNMMIILPMDRSKSLYSSVDHRLSSVPLEISFTTYIYCSISILNISFAAYIVFFFFLSKKEMSKSLPCYIGFYVSIETIKYEIPSP